MPEKTPKIGDRIKVLEAELKKSTRQLELGNGEQPLISNGLLGDWASKDLDFTSKTLEKFLNYYDINRNWWKTGQPPIFNKNLTSVDIRKDNDVNASEAGEIYRKLVEANTAYRLVPKSILDEEYRIVLKSEMENKQKMLEDLVKAKDDLLVSKNDLIAQLKEEIALLRSKKIASPKEA